MERAKSFLSNFFYKLTTKRQLILFALITILLWRILKNNVILLVLIAYLVWTSREIDECENCVQEETLEAFDKTGTVFADIGEPKYDLMGERVYFRPPEYDIPSNNYSCCRY